MDTTYEIIPITPFINLSNSRNIKGVNGIKGGISLDFETLVAYTADNYLVPIDHPEAVIFAGLTHQNMFTSIFDQPELGLVKTKSSLEIFDNSNGEDGDKFINVFRGNQGFPAAGLTEPLNLTTNDYGRVIFASGNRTLHVTPGKGRLPIGVLYAIGQADGEVIGNSEDQIYYWINLDPILPIYQI